MVKINRIYTRNGDKGDTHLAGGTRIAKDSLRVEAYGSVDELNAALVMAGVIAMKSDSREAVQQLAQIQNELFDAGAELAIPPGTALPKERLLGAEETLRLERSIDEISRRLPELASFLLPGSCELSAALHLARTVCRRAERAIVRLSRQEPVRAELLAYFNRLGDFLFALARSESHHASGPERLWSPKGE